MVMVMVKNSNDIQVVRIFVLTLFLLVVVLDAKSNARGICLYNSTDIKYYIPERELTEFIEYLPDILSLEAKKNSFCDKNLLSSQKSSHLSPKHNLIALNKLNNPYIYSNITKQTGIHPINGPPAEILSIKTEYSLTEQNELDQFFSASLASSGHSLQSSETQSTLLSFTKTNLIYYWRNYYNSVNRNSVTNKINDTIKINDPLQIICPDDISIYTDINTCTSYITQNLNVSFSGDDLVSLTWKMTGATEDTSPSSGFNQINDYTFNEGTTTITYTLKDRQQNTVTCSFRVVISDNQVPRMINLPDNITAYTEAGECNATVNWTAPTAIDNCTAQEDLIWSESHQPGSIFSFGITEVTYSVKDAFENTKDSSFYITVIDNEPPEIRNCPNDIVVNADPGSCEAGVTWIEPSVSDNCTSLQNISWEKSNLPGSSFPVGTTRVIYKAIDESGNIEECHFNITVTDNEAPLIIPPPDIQLYSDESVPSSWSNYDDFLAAGGLASDNCELDEASFQLISETRNSDSIPFTITRTYQISDSSGNTASAVHYLRVREEEVNLKSGQTFLADFTAMQSGLWSDKATWGGADPPSAADDVTIPSGVTVTVDIPAFCKNMDIQNGGTINYSGTQTLQVHGNWTNNGNYDGGTSGIVEFAGSNSITISGSTTFEDIIIDKGTDINTARGRSDY